MKIVIKSSPKYFKFPFRIIGQAGRYDTVSDCAFVDNTHIICADRQMACLYLIEFDLINNTHIILDSATCICNNTPVHFELISIWRDPITSVVSIYSVSYKNTLFTCNLVNNKFCNFKTTLINSEDNYHGVLAHENGIYVTNMKKPTITNIDMLRQYKKTFICEGGVRMKDVAVVDADNIITISSNSGPITGVQNADGTVYPTSAPYDSHIILSDAHTGSLISKYTLKNTQIDACIYKSPYCYVTCTDEFGAGYILRTYINTITKQFEDIIRFPCAGFPHGLDMYGDIFAYTSYSDSALYIYPISDLKI